MDPKNRVLRKTSQWVGSLPRALLLSKNITGEIFVEARANKPHGMGLALIYRAEYRCESSGAPAGAFPRPPRGQVGQGSCPKSMVSGPEIGLPDMISAGFCAQQACAATPCPAWALSDQKARATLVCDNFQRSRVELGFVWGAAWRCLFGLGGRPGWSGSVPKQHVFQQSNAAICFTTGRPNREFVTPFENA